MTLPKGLQGAFNGGKVHGQPELNPFLKHLNGGRRELPFVGRHFMIHILVGDHLQEITFVRALKVDRFTGISASKQGISIDQAQATP